MIRKILFSVAFALAILVSSPLLQACDECEIVGAIYGDEYELYWICAAPRFPRGGYSFCDADSYSIEQGGHCFYGGERCAWVALPENGEGDRQAFVAAPAPAAPGA